VCFLHSYISTYARTHNPPLLQFNFWVPHFLPSSWGRRIRSNLPLTPSQFIFLWLLLFFLFFSFLQLLSQPVESSRKTCAICRTATGLKEFIHTHTHTHTQGPIRCGETTLYKQKLIHIRHILILIFWKWYQYTFLFYFIFKKIKLFFAPTYLYFHLLQ
jgi:hypothetical protein